jgi:hypothetical protein
MSRRKQKPSFILLDHDIPKDIFPHQYAAETATAEKVERAEKPETGRGRKRKAQ